MTTAEKIRARYPAMPLGLENELEIKVNPNILLFDIIKAVVIACIRHRYTNYDGLLRGGMAKERVREMINPQIGQIYSSWQRTDKKPK